jgi:hypothetical protein
MSGQQCSHYPSEEDAVVHTGTTDAQELRFKALQVRQMQQIGADQRAKRAGDVGDDWSGARSDYFGQKRCGEWRYKRRQHNSHRPCGPCQRIRSRRDSGDRTEQRLDRRLWKQEQIDGERNERTPEIDGDDLLTYPGRPIEEPTRPAGESFRPRDWNLPPVPARGQMYASAPKRDVDPAASQGNEEYQRSDYWRQAESGE